MSIRAIAVDLYRAKQQVVRCEERLQGASQEEISGLKQELAAARCEHELLFKMLEGKKEAGSYEQKFAKNRFHI